MLHPIADSLTPDCSSSAIRDPRSAMPGPRRRIRLTVTLDRRAFLTAATLAALRPLRLDAAGWRAGVATVDITPRQSLWMAGFAARTQPSQGTAQPLHAKALAIEDLRRQRVVVVTLDLLGVTAGMADRIGAAVAKQHRVPRERLLLASSHTHSGPVVDTQLMVAYDVTPQQVRDVEAYTATLEQQIVDVVGQAIRKLAPATLHAGQTTAGFAANRRVQYTPDGPVDHRVPMLRVDVGGKAIAILFSYACHNTTLPATNVEWHGDYAGVAQAAIEAAQPGLTALFMTGCGADANPKPRGTREDVQQHGEALAAAVRQALPTLTPITGATRAALELVDLPFAAALTPEEWKTALRARGSVRGASRKADGRDPSACRGAADDRRRCRCRSGGSATTSRSSRSAGKSSSTTRCACDVNIPTTTSGRSAMPTTSSGTCRHGACSTKADMKGAAPCCTTAARDPSTPRSRIGSSPSLDRLMRSTR